MKGVILVYLLIYGGTAIAIFDPFYGLLAYICLAIIRPGSLFHWAAIPENASMLVGSAMLVGWALKGFGDWRLGKGKWVLLAFAGFWSWALLSTIYSAEVPEKAWGYVELLAKVLLPFIAGLTMIKTIRQVRLLMWTMVFSLGYVAYDLNLSYYSGYNRLYYEGFGSMDNNCVAIALVTGTGLSGFLALASERWRDKAVALAVTALMINAIMFSNSRGGMLALVVMGAVAFFIIPKRLGHYIAFFVILAVGWRLAGGDAVARFKTVFSSTEGRDASAQSRLDLWRDCWDVMTHRPILGCGPENWGEIAPEYGWPQGKYAHSLWVQTGAETGFPGLAIFASFYGLAIVGGWHLTRQTAKPLEPFLKECGRAVVASLVGFVVAAQFVSLWQVEMPYYVALLGASALKVSQFDDKLQAAIALARNARDMAALSDGFGQPSTI